MFVIKRAAVAVIKVEDIKVEEKLFIARSYSGSGVKEQTRTAL
jgi:hypothetical protein